MSFYRIWKLKNNTVSLKYNFLEFKIFSFVSKSAPYFYITRYIIRYRERISLRYRERVSLSYRVMKNFRKRAVLKDENLQGVTVVRYVKSSSIRYSYCTSKRYTRSFFGKRSIYKMKPYLFYNL